MMKRVCTLVAIISICTVLTLSTSGKIDSSDKKSAESVETDVIDVNPTNTARGTTTVFSETFEGAFPSGGSWTVGDSNSNADADYWDDTSYRYYGGSWSGWCAMIGDNSYYGGTNYANHKYDNYMDAYMYKSVSLGSYSSATLSYYYWLDAENSYDILYVIYYSGGSWSYVDMHTGNSGGWQYSSVSIPTSATYVGLHFYSDLSACSYEGAYIDDVVLTGTSSANSPPPAPTLSSPSNSATGISTTPTLICNSVTDPDGDAVSYYFIVDDNADWSSPTTEGFAGAAGDRNYVVGTDGDALSLLAGTKYYWCACAYDGTVFGEWSSAWSFTTAAAVSLGEAVDNTALTWTTGGNANWFGQTTTYYYGSDAAQSGDISDSQSAYIQTTVTGSGELKFYWKVSSESGYDFLRFYIDGTEQSGSISGSIDWQQKSFSIASGSHTLKWAYTKDVSDSSGSDCGWLDKVEFAANSPPPAPTLSSPSNGATGISTTPTLICNSVTDPDGDSVWYYFIVDDNTDWSSPATEGYAGGAGDTNYVVGTDGDGLSLLAGTTYYWCVCAYDGTVFGDWSSARSFTTASANSPPTASFTYSPGNPTTSDTISFTDTSTDSDGTISSWSWDFGDGGSSTLKDPTHKYTSANTYTVTLTVTDDDGATDSASQNIVVTETPNSPPTASFTYLPASPTTDDTVSFTDTSTDSDGTISSWSWDFGDGGSSTLKDPTHKYTSANTYTVTLTVTDDDGAIDSASQSITVTWGTISPSGLVYVLVDSSIYSSIQSSLTTYKSDLENEGYSVGIYSDSWATISDVRSFLQNAPSGLVGAVLVGNLPIAWYYLVNPASWGVDPETFPIELYYMDLDGTWSPGTGTEADPFTGHTGNTAPEIWIGRLYASTAGGTEVTLLQNYFSKNHNYRLGNLELSAQALVYVDDDWYSYADTWSNNVGLLYSDRTLVKDKETTTATDYKNRLAQDYEWVSLFSHSGDYYHCLKYNSGASWSYVYNTEITTVNPHAFFYNLYCCHAANYAYGSDNGYIGGRYIFGNTYGLEAVGSTKTGSMLNFDDFYSPLGNGKSIGNAFKDWYTLNGETGQGADSRAWFYGMTILGDPTLKPNSTTTDTTPPTGSISINSGATYTTTTSVTLTLSASDAETGVLQMCFSNDGTTYTAWEAYGTSKTWTLTTGDGSKTVYVKYKNGAGLVSSAYSDAITLDTTAPTGLIVINSGDTYATSTSVKLTLSASDATTGVSQMCFSNDGTTYTAWEAYGTSKTWTLTAGDGAKTVYVKYKDNAGLESGAYSDAITLDTTAPTGSIVINSDNVYTTSTSVILTLSASDTTSGVSQMCFSNDGTTYTAWEAYATSKSWTLPTSDGKKTVYVKYKDNAALESGAYSDAITLDTTAPTGSIVINSGNAYTTSTSVTLTLSASDTTSEVYQMCFSNDDTTYTAWEAYGTSKIWTLTADDEPKTVYVKYKDNAGLISSSYSDTITLDTTAPTGSIVINSGNAYTTSTSVTLTLSASDKTSGVSQMCFSNDGTTYTAWETYATSKTWTLTTGDGTKTVYVKYKDGAGLDSSAYFNSITLDTTAPKIVSTTPLSNAVNVSLTQNIIIQFSEEINTGSVQYICFPNPSGWISSWNAAQDILTLIHNDFNFDVLYTFNVTAAKDAAGNNLVSGLVSNPWTFATKKEIKFSFSKGQNFLTLPFINNTINNAESLANAIGKNCTGIAYWDNTLGRFITHPAGTNISNFNIKPGVGYMVFISDTTDFTFAGDSKVDGVTMSLGVGWNAIGRFNATTTAESIGSTVSNCTHVAKWNAASQSFDVYTVGSGVNNFNIEQGEGYFVYVTKESQWVNN